METDRCERVPGVVTQCRVGSEVYWAVRHPSPSAVGCPYADEAEPPRGSKGAEQSTVHGENDGAVEAPMPQVVVQDRELA